MRFTKPIALILLLSFSFALGKDVVRSPLQETCVLITGKLSKQRDHDFSHHFRALGGLCGPTCAVNAAQAAFKLTGRWGYSKARLMDIFVDVYNNSPANTDRHDARGGTSSRVMQHALPAFFKRIGFNGAKFVEAKWLKTAEDIDRLADSLNKGSIGILSVETIDAKGWSNPNNAHGILVTGFDANAKKLYYIDPNRPSEEQSMTYSTRKYEGGVERIAFEAPGLNYLLDSTRSDDRPRIRESIVGASYLENYEEIDLGLEHGRIYHFFKNLTGGQPSNPEKGLFEKKPN